jgi:uncharacterized protein (TIGR02594 family)
MTELPWIAKARTYIGLKENVSRTEHNPVLLDMLASMGKYTGESRAWWNDDESAWCGLFVGYVLGDSKRYVAKEWYRAKAWETIGMTELEKPAYGCIVTFTRNGGGHVGFVVGKDTKGNIMVLGGNQSNMVSIVPFALSRVSGYYWPSMWKLKQQVKSVPTASRYQLTILKSNGQLSTNEA